MKLEIETEVSDDMFLCQHVADGGSKETDLTYNLATTIGLGGLDFILDVKKGDVKIKETVNLRSAIMEWIKEVEKRIDAGG